MGALLVTADGELLGEGWNRNLAEHDPSAHAEIVAMRQAGARLGNHRLVGKMCIRDRPMRAMVMVVSLVCGGGLQIRWLARAWFHLRCWFLFETIFLCCNPVKNALQAHLVLSLIHI